MGIRRDSVRGRVILTRKDSTDKEWDVRKTLAVCMEVDGELEREGLEPAPQFRSAVKSHDQNYLIRWVWGCHFPWLNAR